MSAMNRRVEEDLNKIRMANSPPELTVRGADTAPSNVSLSDSAAMMIALLSIVLPYAAALALVLLAINFGIQLLA